MKKIAYVSTNSLTNIRNWSGLNWYIGKALQMQDFNLNYIDKLPISRNLFLRLKSSFYRRFTQKHYQRERDPITLKHYANSVQEKLINLDSIDFIFSQSTIPIAELKSDIPMVFWTDATFAGMIGFYPEFNNLCRETIKHGNQLEKKALEKAKFAIYSSDWAAETAIKYYQIEPSKIKVIPFGANVNDYKTLETIKDIVNARPRNICKLLFLGVDWQRKGGEIALKVTEKLNKIGLISELTVVGCNPFSDIKQPKFVKCEGFISKSSKTGREKINNLLAESHFLILPCDAECYGLVFCEANAFGVPVLATKVGGIPTIIKNGKNGNLFEKQETISSYVSYISNLFHRYAEYKKLALSSFHEFETRLNWKVASAQFKKLVLN
ncbi:MAG: glycosyltransferase family 4 protein [Xenococcaceae cyanobacterium MO_188.B19]|nr:glycosyltransferase family 4 protein [Xenococcaceae cyanobacterium MO_188.B19]